MLHVLKRSYTSQSDFPRKISKFLQIMRIKLAHCKQTDSRGRNQTQQEEDEHV